LEKGVLSGLSNTAALVMMASKSFRMLALGDSYTIASGLPQEDSWPYQLTSQIRQNGIKIANPNIIAQSGWTSLNLIEALNADPPSGSFDLVCLQIGVNDQYERIESSFYEENFKDLLDQSITFARKGPNGVLVLSIPDWSVTPHAGEFDRIQVREELGQYNAINLAAARSRGVKYVDVTSNSRFAEQHPELLADDGLHPTWEMYWNWTGLIQPTALSILRSATEKSDHIPSKN
jgi:acyl-CoA thioesterase-1